MKTHLLIAALLGLPFAGPAVAEVESGAVCKEAPTSLECLTHQVCKAAPTGLECGKHRERLEKAKSLAASLAICDGQDVKLDMADFPDDRLPFVHVANAAQANACETVARMLSGLNFRDRNVLVRYRRYDDDKKTLLHYAAIGNAVDTAKLLIAHGADIDGYSSTESVFLAGLSLSHFGTPFELAVFQNAFETAKLLLDSGAYTHRTMPASMRVATYENNVKAVEFLLANGAEVDSTTDSSSERTPLHFAAYRNAAEIAKLLISYGADINARAFFDEHTPLHDAASQNAVETAEVLIANGANVNEQSDNGKPIVLAMAQNAIETAKLLIAKGADVSEVLWEAVHRNDVKMAEFLIANGADVDITVTVNGVGFMPIHLAASINAVKMVEFLIANGVDVNVNTKIGTPLHSAASGNAVGAAKLLLTKGAKVNALDGIDETPLDKLFDGGRYERKHARMVKVLLDNGGGCNIHCAQ